jgi:hypothetical protein
MFVVLGHEKVDTMKQVGVCFIVMKTQVCIMLVAASNGKILAVENWIFHA